MNHDSFPVVRCLLRVKRNPWEVCKRNRKFLCKLWARLTRGKHVGWARIAGLTRCLKGLKRLLFPVFYFSRDLASASLVEEPKGEETAQAKGHGQVWFCDLGKSWSEIRLDPNCSLCKQWCFPAVNRAPKQQIPLEMNKHHLQTFLLPSLPHLGQQHSFLILAILYLGIVAAESVFTRHSLMLNLERSNAPQKVLSQTSNMSNVLQIKAGL